MEIREEGPGALAQYATVPIAYEVREVLALEPMDGGLGGLRLTSRTLDAPYAKDYDAIPGNHPSDWAARFDLRTWGILSAWDDGVRIGGAVVAFGAAGVEMLEGRRDLAVLWDLRVAPRMRGRGAGTALFRAAERWAAARGARWLKVETQNVNVAACRFYARQGCTLGAIHRFAYPDLPGEAQLLWYKEIAPPM